MCLAATALGRKARPLHLLTLKHVTHLQEAVSLVLHEASTCSAPAH